jgi:hypothetical protein
VKNNTLPKLGYLSVTSVCCLLFFALVKKLQQFFSSIIGRLIYLVENHVNLIESKPRPRIIRARSLEISIELHEL